MATSSPTVDSVATRATCLPGVLDQVVEDAKQLLGAAVVGFLFADDESGDLVLQHPAIGLAEGRICHLRIPMNEGSISANVLRTGAPSMSNCVASDLTSMPQATHASGVRNHIAVPVEVHKRRVGVLHLGDKPGGFSTHDLRLAMLFSSHLGILCDNAAMLEEERRRIDVLERALATHHELTRAVLDGQGLDVISSNLSRLVANPVGISDRFGNVLSHYPQDSNDCHEENWRRIIAKGRSPRIVHDEPRVSSLVEDLVEKRSAQRVPGRCLRQATSLVVAPVIVGPELLAYVSVWEATRELDELDFKAVEAAATATALHMMKEKAAAETQYRLVGELVAELIKEAIGSEEPLLRRAAYLGVDLKARRAVMIVEIDDLGRTAFAGLAEAKIVALKTRLLKVVERACKVAGTNAVVAAKDDEIVVLAEVNTRGQSADDGPTLALADLIRAEIRQGLPGCTASVGIGGCCQDLHDFSECYREARRALNVIRASHQPDRTAVFSKLGSMGVLFDPRIVGELATTARKTLGALVDYDRRHGSQLLQTLEQYLLHHCHVNSTAEAMCLYKGTVRYRLRRVEQLTGADLDNADSKFNLQLALKVLRTLDVN